MIEIINKLKTDVLIKDFLSFSDIEFSSLSILYDTNIILNKHQVFPIFDIGYKYGAYSVYLDSSYDEDMPSIFISNITETNEFYSLNLPYKLIKRHFYNNLKRDDSCWTLSNLNYLNRLSPLMNIEFDSLFELGGELIDINKNTLKFDKYCFTNIPILKMNKSSGEFTYSNQIRMSYFIGYNRIDLFSNSVHFKKELNIYFSKYTQELFQKDFNQITKKEFDLLIVYFL